MAVTRKTTKPATEEEKVEDSATVEDVNETTEEEKVEDVNETTEEEKVEDVNETDNVQSDVESDSVTEGVEPSEYNSNGVAVYASHPMYWPGVGSLKAGYSVLKADVAEQWIAQGWVRKASRSEVARQYGIK